MDIKAIFGKDGGGVFNRCRSNACMLFKVLIVGSAFILHRIFTQINNKLVWCIILIYYGIKDYLQELHVRYAFVIHLNIYFIVYTQVTVVSMNEHFFILSVTLLFKYI